MNKIEILEVEEKKDEYPFGIIYKSNSGEFYMTVPDVRHGDGKSVLLINLRTGNYWSLLSTFGEKPEDFERFTGTLKIQTT